MSSTPSLPASVQSSLLVGRRHRHACFNLLALYCWELTLESRTIPSIHFAQQVPKGARPAPRYGNIVSVASSVVTIVCYPSSRLQAKRQCLRDGRTPMTYTFEIGQLPNTQQSRDFWSAIERWQASSAEQLSDEQDNDSCCGPRVTFLDGDEATAYNIRAGSCIIPVPAGPCTSTSRSRAGHASSSTGDGGFGAESKSAGDATKAAKKYGHHHQHRRRRSLEEASSGSEAHPKWAVDIGLVWWTSDLHGHQPQSV